MDMIARTHKKKRSTCRRDSPRFLLKNHNETLKMATSMVKQVTTWAQGRTKLSSVSRISLRPGFFIISKWINIIMVRMRIRMVMMMVYVVSML